MVNRSLEVRGILPLVRKQRAYIKTLYKVLEYAPYNCALITMDNKVIMLPVNVSTLGENYHKNKC